MCTAFLARRKLICPERRARSARAFRRSVLHVHNRDKKLWQSGVAYCTDTPMAIDYTGDTTHACFA